MSTTDILRKVVNDGERISDEIVKELPVKDMIYCQLNVDHTGLTISALEIGKEVRAQTQK